ncbi:hypothetical protein F5I97DRAFT_949768 [Phlebopus sp. FC_14]|nr:hypothetical protein F5I97DRAFT_949768 [Phlebopus sp. FC_14]
MDDLHPLPSFARRRTARVQGPRPCSWSTSTPSIGERDLWPWAYQKPNLSRASIPCSRSSTESTHSYHSSQTSFSSSLSSSLDCTPNISLDSKSRTRRSHRRRPAGPRPRCDVPPAAVRPALSVKTSLSPEIDMPPQQLEAPIQSAYPDSPRLSMPEPPPLSPTNYLLDWDVIFQVLNI